MNVVFAFAHQDDEYAALPWIADELSQGNQVSCVYLTDGGSRTDPRVRDSESTAVLKRLGVSAHDISFLGSRYAIHDGCLLRNVPGVQEAFRAWLNQNAQNVGRIYSPAWEGGHPDHDIVHVLVLLEATERHILEDCWQFTIYNGYGCRKLFRSLRQLPRKSKKRVVRYSLMTAIDFAFTCFRYRSQLRTWIGLFPEAFVRRIFGRREFVVPLSADAVMRRPHKGQLLYERMFATSYAELSEAIKPVLTQIMNNNAGSRASRGLPT